MDVLKTSPNEGEYIIHSLAVFLYRFYVWRICVTIVTSLMYFTQWNDPIS